MNHQSIFPPIKPQETEPVQSPMIYVKEGPAWEYRQLVRDTTKDKLPTDDELNALGRQGWELAGVLSQRKQIYFYFKRMK